MGYAGAMEGDISNHAVAVDRIGSVLKVQTDNDEIRGIFFFYKNGIETFF
jgi:hypothetical protein